MTVSIRGTLARLRGSTRMVAAWVGRGAVPAFIVGAGVVAFVAVDVVDRSLIEHAALDSAELAHVAAAAPLEQRLRMLAASAQTAAGIVERSRLGPGRAPAWPLEQLAAERGLSGVAVYWSADAAATVVGAAPEDGATKALNIDAPRIFAARQAEGAVMRWNVFAAHPVETREGWRGVVVVGAARERLFSDLNETRARPLAIRSDAFDLSIERGDATQDAETAQALDAALRDGGFAAPVSEGWAAPFAAASAFDIDGQRIAVATAHPSPWTPEARAEHLLRAGAAALGAASLALLLAALVVWRPRRIIRTLLSSIETSQKAGVMFIEGIERTDDLGDLARSIERLAQEHKRMHAALDASRSMMMIANRAGLIFYVNPQLREMFVEHADKFSEEFPGVPFPDVEGSLLSVFHDKLGMSEDASSEKSGRIVAGGRKLDIHVTPIRDRLGVQIGAFAQWDDVTGELEIETEIDGMVDMISMGELDMRMAISSERGVYAKVGDGVNQLMEILSDSVAKLNAFLASMAQGDLSQTMPDDMMGSFGELASSANSTVRRVAGVVAEIRDAAQTLTAEVERLREDMQQLSARSEEATRSLGATTDAAQTLTDSIVSNAERLREADTLAKRTSEAAGRGAAVARDSTAAMKAIETSSSKVTDIADVIDEIAFQTNMLALNAAVEAARAGEAGRGFSVVATEVRALSQRVAASAADIKQLLDRSNAEVRRGVQLAREAGGALAEIEAGLTQSAALIAGIAEGGRAQEQGVATMTAALDSLSEITHRNADMAQGAAEAIQQMSALADRLDAGVSFFHGEPEGMALIGADGGMTADDLPPWPEDGETSSGFDPSDWTDVSDPVSAGDLPSWEETELDRSLAAFDADAEMEAMIREAEKASR